MGRSRNRRSRSRARSGNPDGTGQLEMDDIGSETKAHHEDQGSSTGNPPRATGPQEEASAAQTAPTEGGGEHTPEPSDTAPAGESDHTPAQNPDPQDHQKTPDPTGVQARGPGPDSASPTRGRTQNKRKNYDAFSGPILKQLREEQGITLKEISKRTKIGVTTLVALEEERFDDVPGARVYVRGFVRCLANELGLDQDEVSRSYVPRWEGWHAAR